MELFKLFTAKNKFKILLFLFIFLLITSFACAEELFINLKAETFRYDEVSGVVVAEGNVEVEIEGFFIKADHETS